MGQKPIYLVGLDGGSYTVVRPVSICYVTVTHGHPLGSLRSPPMVRGMRFPGNLPPMTNPNFSPLSVHSSIALWNVSD